MNIKRGQVYWYKFEDFSYHPVVVIQNNLGNKHSYYTVVVELSSSETLIPKAGKIPTIVPVYREEYTNCNNYHKIKPISYALCSNIYTLEITKFGNYHGTLNRFAMKRIEKGLKISIGLEG